MDRRVFTGRWCLTSTDLQIIIPVHARVLRKLLSERSRVSRYIIAMGRAVSRFASADVLPDCDGQALVRDTSKMYILWPMDPTIGPRPAPYSMSLHG
jgi:hypothetical protein